MLGTIKDDGHSIRSSHARWAWPLLSTQGGSRNRQLLLDEPNMGIYEPQKVQSLEKQKYAGIIEGWVFQNQTKIFNSSCIKKDSGLNFVYGES